MGNKDMGTGIVLMICLFGIIGYILYDVFRTEGFRVSAIMLPTIMVSMLFMDKYGVWSMTFKMKGFMTMTGMKGVIVRGPISVDNARVKYEVSFFAPYIHDEKQRQSYGGLYVFRMFLSQRIVIPIVDFQERFIDLPSNCCDDPKGCIVYRGSPNNTAVMGFDKVLSAQIDAISHELNIAHTRMQKMNLHLETLSQSEDRSMALAAQKIKTLMDLTYRPTTVMVGPQGSVVPLQSNDYKGGN